MAKKNRKRNAMLAAAAAEAKAAEEGKLPPPPAAITPIDNVAAATQGVREQQLGLVVDKIFTDQQKVDADRASLEAQRASFESEQEGYEKAYAKSRAAAPEERGAVIANIESDTELQDNVLKLVKVAVVFGGIYLAWKSFA